MATPAVFMALGTAPAVSNILGMDVSAGLTATGTTAATALVLVNDLNMFTTVGASTGALLPPATTADQLGIQNGGASPLTVYPAGTDKINNTTSFTVTNGKTAIFLGSGGNWIAILSA